VSAGGPPRRSRPEPPPEIARTAHRYQATVGAIGLLLVIAFSAYLFTHGSPRAPGVGAGRPLPRFVAPLASSDLDASANPDPRCDPERPARRGLNVCDRGAIVLDLFSPAGGACVRSVDAIQRVSSRFRGVTFAAVAVQASQSTARALVRKHRWTIPVAYDSDGAIQQLYGVAVCPLIEVARRGGRVAARLIGRAWSDPARLAGAISRALGGAG
jgi:hypothetical protein